MRNIYLVAILAAVVFVSCINIFNKTVYGNGNMSTVERHSNNTDRIKSAGSFDITVIQGSPSSVKIRADENLIPYIVTEDKNGALEIHAKRGYNLRSDNKLQITVTTPQLELVDLAGSGNVRGEGKFTGRERLKISVAGTGNIDLNVNAPDVESHIAGTGNISLAGESRNSSIEIAGVGDYKAQDLKSENVEIHIAGSGNARVYAEDNLDIHIAGSGDVYYKGNAQVKQNIAGSGKVRKE